MHSTVSRVTSLASSVAGSALGAAVLLAALLLTSGCGRPAEPVGKGPEYATTPANRESATRRFAIHPLHNPVKLREAYGPLISYLNDRIPGANFEVEASRDYQDYERKFRARGPEVLLPNPWHTLQAQKVGYTVIAMAGEPQDFKGLFIVRRDSGIRTVADLNNRIIAYPSRTALAACIMPQWYLHENGLDVNKDVINRYVGSQESSIMNAFLGQAVAGCTWPPPWRSFQHEHPQEAAQLMVLWETPSLVNNSVMVRSDLPPELRRRLQELLVDLHNHPEGRAILAGMETARFLLATDADYQVVQPYITRFEAEVRPVEQ
jgi:phosphonate transport system substrate-binding protein